MENLDRRGKGLAVAAGALLVGAVGFGVLSQPRQSTAAPAMPAKKIAPAAHIDVVFAIDCSGSMGPVIENAKRKVWTIVNQIAKAKPSPVLRIGLIGYGNGAETHRVFPLSDDLDTVYKNLMTFRDEGWSAEYVGLAVSKATLEMDWSKGAMGLKAIYVLGNETARQGPLDYAKSAPAAADKDIIINAIFCDASGRRMVANTSNRSGQSAGVQPAAQQKLSVHGNIVPIGGGVEPNSEQFTWQEMAQLGKGQFMVIQGDGGTVAIATPYDNELIELGKTLNKTYIPYGRAGTAGASNQIMQDSNSAAVGGVDNLATRSAAKAGAQYNNRNWDLVDAAREKDFDMAKVKADDLPEAMRGLSADERKAYVAKHEAERVALQKKIRDLNEKRDAYIQEQLKKQGVDTANSFDDSVRRSITEQAEKKGFKF